MIQRIKDKVAEIWSRRSTIDVTVRKARSLFSQEILDERMPSKLQSLQTPSYYRQADFVDTIDHLSALMD